MKTVTTFKPRTHRRTRHLASAAAIAIGIASLTLPAAAHAQTAQRSYAIEAQDLGDALRAFAVESGVDVVFDPTLVKGKRSRKLDGKYDARQGLARLIAGSGLALKATASGGYAITPGEPGVAAGGDRGVSTGGRAIAKGGSAATATQSVSFSEQDRSVDADYAEVVVTGTRLRGISDQFSNVSTVSRDRLDRSGIASVPELLTTLPQNHGSGAGNVVGSTLSNNGPGAVAANLRGLGPEATLTLINGRRMAPGGLQGDVVDLSAVPVAAIDRVEIMADGGSAIYGADAIAGVVNIILNERFDGVETRLKVGTSTQGGGTQLIAGQTVGKTWSQGRGLISYEFGLDRRINAADRDASSMAASPTDLYPYIKRHSLFATGSINLLPSLTVYGDGFYSHRYSESTTSLLSSNRTFRDTATAEKIGANVGARLELGSDWETDAYASFSKSLAPQNRATFNRTTGALVQNLLNRSEAELYSVEGTLSGPLFRMPGGAATILIGANARKEMYDGYSVNSFGVSALDVNADRDIKAIFGELYIPFISDSNSTSAINRLSVTAAIRHEEYSDFGGTTNPRLGILYSPLSGVSFRATYGTSFRAPRLQQQQDIVLDTFLANYIDPAVPSGRSVALVYGALSATGLQPEKSRSYTFGIDIEPTSIPNLSLKATYFDINFSNQIVSLFPSIDFNTFDFFDSLNPIIRNVSQGQVQDIISKSVRPLINFAGVPTSQATIIIDARPLNAAATTVRGIDFDLAYGVDAPFGTFRGSLQGTYLLKFAQQTTSAGPAASRLNTVGWPLKFRLTGEIAFATRTWNISLFGNHAGAYRDTVSPTLAKSVSSWTTFDLSATHTFAAKGSALEGIKMTISVRNLLDSNPPYVAPRGAAQQYSFDPANADARGRFVALQITKQW